MDISDWRIKIDELDRKLVDPLEPAGAGCRMRLVNEARRGHADL